MDIHRKSVDMDMDMDVKFHIHGNPGAYTVVRAIPLVNTDKQGPTKAVNESYLQRANFLTATVLIYEGLRARTGQLVYW